MANREIDDLLIQKFLSGQATEEEANSLIRYLGENQDNRLRYFINKRIWLASKNRQGIESAYADRCSSIGWPVY